MVRRMSGGHCVHLFMTCFSICLQESACASDRIDVAKYLPNPMFVAVVARQKSKDGWKKSNEKNVPDQATRIYQTATHWLAMTLASPLRFAFSESLGCYCAPEDRQTDNMNSPGLPALPPQWRQHRPLNPILWSLQRPTLSSSVTEQICICAMATNVASLTK